MTSHMTDRRFFVTRIILFASVVLAAGTFPKASFALIAGGGDPNPPETTIIEGDLVLTESDTTSILIEDAEPGGFDRIEVTGSATLGGLLSIRFLGDIHEDDVFEILTAPSVLGEFDDVVARKWLGIQRYGTDVVVGETSVSVRIIPPAFILGDMNGDGLFDAFDVAPFELALANPDAYALQYPGLNPVERGDLTQDGRFDAFDVPTFETISAGGASTPLPEPGSLLTLTLGGLALLRSRRVGTAHHD